MPELVYQCSRSDFEGKICQDITRIKLLTIKASIEEILKDDKTNSKSSP